MSGEGVKNSNLLAGFLGGPPGTGGGAKTACGELRLDARGMQSPTSIQSQHRKGEDKDKDKDYDDDYYHYEDDYDDGDGNDNDDNNRKGAGNGHGNGNGNGKSSMTMVMVTSTTISTATIMARMNTSMKVISGAVSRAGLSGMPQRG